VVKKALIGDRAADEEASCPDVKHVRAELGRRQVGELEVSPVGEPLPLGAEAGRPALPGLDGQRLRDFIGCAGHLGLVAPRPELVLGAHAEHIALAGAAQARLDLADAVNAVACHPGERHVCGDSPLDHPGRYRRRGGEGDLVRHMGRRPAMRIAGPALGQVELPVDQRVSACP
jgi:hypothetical protein